MKRQKEFKSVRSFGEVPASVLRCFVIRIGCRGLCTEQTVSGTVLDKKQVSL